MSGWIPTPADGWPSIAEALSSTGAPWPEAAAVTDLRWYEDRGLDIPGRPTLRARWRWTDWAVRSLLQRENDWRDPLRRQPTASASPADRQRSASRPPAAERSNADSRADSASRPPALRQPTASAPPAGLHTRGDPPSHSPPPSPSQAAEEQRAHAREAAPPLEDEPVEESSVESSPPELIEEDIAVLVALQERDEPQHGLASQRDRAALRQALTGRWARDQLCALWAWSAVSEDPIIAGCRKGWRRWASLLRRPSGEARIEAALAWVAAGRPVVSTTGPPVAQSSRRRFSVSELGEEDIESITHTGASR